jgi:hypothetical protein
VRILKTELVEISLPVHLKCPVPKSVKCFVYFRLLYIKKTTLSQNSRSFKTMPHKESKLLTIEHICAQCYSLSTDMS